MIDCPLARAANATPNAVYVDSKDFAWSYFRFNEYVDELATRLADAGVSKDMRIALEAETSVELLLFFWALLRCNAAAVLYSPRWTPLEVRATLDRVRPHGCLTADEMRRSMADSNSSVECMSNIEHDDEPSKSTPRLATLIFSSGSTGVPKAIGHELAAHLASARGSNQNLPVAKNDRWLFSLPLFHVAGIGIVFRCTIANATIVLPTADATIAENVCRHQPTHLSLVPTQLGRLLSKQPRPPANLKAVLLGGAPLPHDLRSRALQNAWPLFTTYGLSEMASQVTTSRCRDDSFETSGRLIPGRELMISDSGEILVRGRTLFAGYFEDMKLRLPLTDDGWFATGDLGRLDQSGNLTVTGRRDNMFVSGGENIHPEEIERELLRLKGVEQAIVVPVPDAEFGQRPIAFIDTERIDENAIRRMLEPRLTRFRIPDRFFEWPKQDGLKPKRKEMEVLARAKTESQG